MGGRVKKNTPRRWTQGEVESYEVSLDTLQRRVDHTANSNSDNGRRGQKWGQGWRQAHRQLRTSK